MPITLILALIPLCPKIVAGIEHIFGHGTGPAKKQAATSALADVLNVLAGTESTPGANSSAMDFIDDMIEACVKLYNNSGTFTHGTSVSTTLPNV
jgi:hypothetical protein